MAAAALTPEAVSLDALDCAKPLLLAFGNERDGLTEEVSTETRPYPTLISGHNFL